MRGKPARSLTCYAPVNSPLLPCAFQLITHPPKLSALQVLAACASENVLNHFNERRRTDVLLIRPLALNQRKHAEALLQRYLR